MVRPARRPGPAPRGRRPTCPRPCAAARWSARRSTCIPSSAWPAATSPAPGCSTTASTARSAASRCRPGSQDGRRLPEPIFTPATKAALGDHDENVDYDAVVEAVGDDEAAELRMLTLEVYGRAEELARERGIILADTKLEFGAPARRHHRARRRGAHARLVALLAGRRVAARPRPAVVRQADRPRLAASRRSPAGTARPARPRRRCRPRSSSARERGTSRPTSC